MRFRSPKLWGTGFSRKAKFALVALVFGATLPVAGFADGRGYVSVFAEQMKDNEWGELFDNRGAVRWRQCGAGMAASRFAVIGAERQALRHFGERAYFEITTPIFLRMPLGDHVRPWAGQIVAKPWVPLSRTCNSPEAISTHIP